MKYVQIISLKLNLKLSAFVIFVRLEYIVDFKYLIQTYLIIN